MNTILFTRLVILIFFLTSLKFAKNTAAQDNSIYFNRRKPHRFGMLEPTPDLPVIAPSTLEVILVPGVAFDRRGGRLGFGGGYYDRFLPTTPALRVAATYDECLSEALPCGEHDQRMDWVVTPTEEIHCAPLWRRAAARALSTPS